MFNRSAKKIQNKHVENKMHPVDMQKARSDKAMVLFVNAYLLNTEFVTFIEIAVLETFP